MKVNKTSNLWDVIVLDQIYLKFLAFGVVLRQLWNTRNISGVIMIVYDCSRFVFLPAETAA